MRVISRIALVGCKLLYMLHLLYFTSVQKHAVTPTVPWLRLVRLSRRWRRNWGQESRTSWNCAEKRKRNSKKTSHRRRRCRPKTAVSVITRKERTSVNISDLYLYLLARFLERNATFFQNRANILFYSSVLIVDCLRIYRPTNGCSPKLFLSQGFLPVLWMTCFLHNGPCTSCGKRIDQQLKLLHRFQPTTAHR